MSHLLRRETATPGATRLPLSLAQCTLSVSAFPCSQRWVPSLHACAYPCANGQRATGNGQTASAIGPDSLIVCGPISSAVSLLLSTWSSCTRSQDLNPAAHSASATASATASTTASTTAVRSHVSMVLAGRGGRTRRRRSFGRHSRQRARTSDRQWRRPRHSEARGVVSS